MPTQMYTVSAEDAVETVAELLERGGVRNIRIEDIDGEPLADVPGTETPEGGARELMDRFQDYAGGGAQVHLFVDTGAAPDRPLDGGILSEPPEHPEEGEPRRHD